MNTDIEMTDMEELPEDYQDGHTNWKRMLDTLHQLDTQTEFPKDWLREQKRHIEVYAKVIPQFRMSKYMEDKTYQTLVRRVEENLRVLEEGIKNKQLVLDAYGYFIKDMIQVMKMYWEMKELCDIMGNL